MKKAIQIHPADSVAVALQPLRRGEQIVLPSTAVTLQEDIPLGHKFALRDIDAGENIIKYGTIIGVMRWRRSKPVNMSIPIT